MARSSKAKQGTQKKSKTNDICFVIMPFGDWPNEYYDNIYSPAIIKAGLTPLRADDLYRASNIVQDIWTCTKNAKILLADLTDKNANVFYELGLAHALAKPVILVAQELNDIPFDLRSLRVIPYDKNKHNWGDLLLERIVKAIEETIKSPNETLPAAFLETKFLNRTQKNKNKKRANKHLIATENPQPEYAIPKEKRKPDAAFMKPLIPSKALAVIVGNKPLPRTEMVKKVWDYIKKNNLQDAVEKRNINADTNLQKVFGGKKTVSMFEMAKHISNQLS